MHKKKKAEDIIKNHKTEKSDIYKNMMLFYTEKEVLSGEDIFDSLGLKEALHPTSADYQQDAKQVLDFLNQICTYSREKKLNMSDGTGIPKWDGTRNNRKSRGYARVCGERKKQAAE